MVLSTKKNEVEKRSAKIIHSTTLLFLLFFFFFIVFVLLVRLLLLLSLFDCFYGRRKEGIGGGGKERGREG